MTVMEKIIRIGMFIFFYFKKCLKTIESANFRPNRSGNLKHTYFFFLGLMQRKYKLCVFFVGHLSLLNGICHLLKKEIICALFLIGLTISSIADYTHLPVHVRTLRVDRGTGAPPPWKLMLNGFEPPPPPISGKNWTHPGKCWTPS